MTTNRYRVSGKHRLIPGMEEIIALNSKGHKKYIKQTEHMNNQQLLKDSAPYTYLHNEIQTEAIAKSDYYLHHVRQSVRPNATTRLQQCGF